MSDLLERRVVNAYKAKDYKRNDFYLYRRNDLSTWSKEAYDRGEEFFYCRPVNPDDPTGALELCEPEYRWFIKDPKGLTEEEYSKLCGGNVHDKSYSWRDESDELAKKIRQAIYPIVRSALGKFTPEAVHYIADFEIDNEIFEYVIERQ